MFGHKSISFRPGDTTSGAGASYKPMEYSDKGLRSAGARQKSYGSITSSPSKPPRVTSSGIAPVVLTRETKSGSEL